MKADVYQASKSHRYILVPHGTDPKEVEGSPSCEPQSIRTIDLLSSGPLIGLKPEEAIRELKSKGWFAADVRLSFTEDEAGS